MRIKWIVIVAMFFIMAGCAPQAHIQKNTGDVDIFNSFDEVGKSYQKVAELKVKNHRPPNSKNRTKMIESLKSKARKVGAEGVVIIDEGHFVEKSVGLPGLPDSKLHTSFIKGIGIVYE
jgi:hypothetical protein